MSHADRPRWLLAGIAALLFVALAPALWVADPNLDYAFADTDFYDWLANGLWLAGETVDYSGRPPVVPLLLAGLARLDLLALYPLVLWAASCLTPLAAFRLARHVAAPGAACAAVLPLAFAHDLHGLAVALDVDVLAVLFLLLAAESFLAAGNRPRRYLAAGAWAAASALTQGAALLLPLAALPVVLRSRRHHLRRPAAWGGALLFVLPVAAWHFLRPLAVAAASGPAVRHWALLRPALDLDRATSYAWACAALIGPPAALLLASGLGLGVRRAIPALVRADAGAGTASEARLFLVLLAGGLGAFFVLIYDYQANRLLLYPLWPAAALAAELLERLRPRWRAAAVATAIVFAAVPFPPRASDPTTVLVWPAPPVAVEAALTRRPLSASPVVHPSRLDWRRGTLRDLGRGAIHRQVWIAHREATTTTLDRDCHRDRAAGHRGLVLTARDPDRYTRYRDGTRLGNALGLPVVGLPWTWLERHGAALEATPVGALGELRLHALRLPGVAGSWLLATPARDPLPTAATGRGDDGEALAVARRLAAWIAASGVDVVLALPTWSAGEVAWDRYLPFVVRRAEVVLVPPAAAATARRRLADATQHDRARVGPATVRRLTARGREVVLVEPVGSAAGALSPRPAP